MTKQLILGDPVRQLIYKLLAYWTELPSGEIAEMLGLSHANISQHLRRLMDWDLVKMRVDGNKRIYSIDHDGFYEASGWYGEISMAIATNHRRRTSPSLSSDTEPTSGDTG